jgi:DNA-binding NtrC family response regulator
MGHKIILYMSDRADRSNSVLAALKETGCEVVSTNSPTIGIALLYVMHTVDAVVLDNGSREQATFDVAESLKQIRPDVPVMFQCAGQIDSSSSWTDGCVETDQLALELQHFLRAEAVV